MYAPIQIWLQEDGSYREGLNLLRQFGSSSEVQFFERIGRKPYINNDEKEALQKALRQKIKTYSPDEKGVSAKFAPGVARNHSSPSEPESIRRLREQGKSWKKKESFYHAQLVTIAQEPESEGRKKRLFDLAKKILEEVEVNLDRIYDQIRAYEQEGIEPVPQKLEYMKKGVEIYRKIESLRTGIAHKTKKLKQEKSQAEKERLAADIAQKEEEMQKLKDQLEL